MTSRAGRIVSSLATATAVGVAAHYLIKWLAAWNVRQEQKERAWLGDRLYTEIMGTGAPVVVLAGLQGSTRYWNHAFDALASTHRVIYVDALGFGRSPWPDRIGLDEHLAALDRTLQWAGVTEPI